MFYKKQNRVAVRNGRKLVMDGGWKDFRIQGVLNMAMVKKENYENTLEILKSAGYKVI